MPKKMLVADLLCGAGGSSEGAKRALDELGLEMELVCLNHWPTAIETHQRNFPEARHYVQDIATVRPHILVPEGYLDLLLASPTCTYHSVARGGKPTSDQQRSDPWHIITWLTELRVKRIIIENVWEFCGWGPVDPKTGKPIKARKGEYFHAWIETIKRLGFEPEWRKLNAADYGDATTRKRFILMARSDRRRVSWPMPTHRRRDQIGNDLFDTAKPWRPAREIIDWSIRGKSIFNRKKDLAPKTMLRIYAGAERHGWPEPYLVILRNHMAARSIDIPLPTIAANGSHIGLAEPVLLRTDMHRANGSCISGADVPLPTLTTNGGVAVAEPVIMNGRKGNEAKGVSTEPIPTLDTKGGIWLAEPFVLSQASGGAPRVASEPLPTIVTGGQRGSGTALISPYYSNGWQEESGTAPPCYTVDDPVPPITTKGRFGMVVPITHADGSNRARSIDDPLPTLTTANRGELALITAQHGEREGQSPRVHDIGNPTPTIAATGHIDLVEATAEYDILFRMLEPHELAAAMGFNTDETEYEFAGTKTEKIKQIGNAVSVAKMKACVGAIMADAAPKSRMQPPQEYREAAE